VIIIMVGVIVWFIIAVTRLGTGDNAAAVMFVARLTMTRTGAGRRRHVTGCEWTGEGTCHGLSFWTG
ncbi:MAG: hypothetical protein AAGC55_01530, partial [Myxococcota bacterium]